MLRLFLWNTCQLRHTKTRTHDALWTGICQPVHLRIGDNFRSLSGSLLKDSLIKSGRRANLKPSIRGSLVSVFKWRPYLFYNLFLSSFAERRVFNFCIICPSLRDDCQLAISRTIYYYCSCSSFKVVVSFFRTFSLKCIHCYIIRNIKTSFRWVKFKTWFRWLPLVSDSLPWYGILYI